MSAVPHGLERFGLVFLHGPRPTAHQRFRTGFRLSALRPIGGSMRLRWTIVATSVLLAAAGLSPAAAQDCQWRGHLSSGQAIQIKGVNGDISAASSGSGDVEVTATKSAVRSNPAEVRIEVVQGANGITICAVYPNVPGKEPN